ncbi:MAG: ABC transporter ATP-binding protein [Candidatus Aminicenantes bacterium]|nr:ABC transporter ATP-binding protein [Candidatus Aminicenantes bacterium]
MILKTQLATKRFSQKHGEVIALKDVSIEINKGEFVSITGPSGSGKSTLLLMLGGMSTPTQGQVFWENEPIYQWKLKERAQWRAKKVGFVFQSFNLIPYLTVIENVSIAMRLANDSAREKERILQVLADMKLSDRLHHLSSELSVGQQQRVALARALIKNPEILFADEPTGNLDPDTAAEVLAVLKKLNNEGKTIILITHDPNIAKMTQRTIRIVNGEIEPTARS